VSDRILIIEAPYYDEIAAGLRTGAEEGLAAAGCICETISVPGALEIPAVLRQALAARPAFDGYVLLGCVIRGETGHYDVVVNESSRGVMDLVTREGLAVGFGILTTENRDQAAVRADPARGNKGGEAARAALAVIAARRRFTS